MQATNNVKESSLNDFTQNAQEILNSEENEYSDLEIKLISDFLLKFAEITVEIYYSQIENKHNEKGNSNGSGEFR